MNLLILILPLLFCFANIGYCDKYLKIKFEDIEGCNQNSKKCTFIKKSLHQTTPQEGLKIQKQTITMINQHSKKVASFETVYCGVPDKPDCRGLKPVDQELFGDFFIDHDFLLSSGKMEISFLSPIGHKLSVSRYEFK
ncbi:hypothetical protein MXB_3237, partial [Myxobolus squamalis]